MGILLGRRPRPGQRKDDRQRVPDGKDAARGPDACDEAVEIALEPEAGGEHDVGVEQRANVGRRRVERVRVDARPDEIGHLDPLPANLAGNFRKDGAQGRHAQRTTVPLPREGRARREAQ